jgi:murein DD-endopeptidase MepM/ murein hydrolase activator NlpD
MGIDRDRLASYALAAALCLAWTIPAPPASAQERGEVVILSFYNSTAGVNSLARLRPHAGVDFGGQIGAPVLAAADGIVSRVIGLPTGCGKGVVLEHRGFERWTAYCHMDAVSVRQGQTIRRGEQIGLIGMSGNAGNIPHVHLELCTSVCVSHADGDLAATEDPLAPAAGCFDATQEYPTDRLAITFPVSCVRWTRGAEERR